MSESSEELAKTLAALRVDVSPEVVFEAPPKEDAMGETYKKVNDQLGELVRQAPIPIQHITGEGMALVDPAHRRVLRMDHEQGTPARLGCYFEGPPTALEFMSHGSGYWHRATWVDVVDILNLASSGAIEIRLLPKREPVHFSLFADRFVLLQAEHTHPRPTKWVWYLESEELVDQLRPRVDEILDDARKIDQRGFDNVLDWLYDFETVSTLRAAVLHGESPIGDSSAAESAGRLEALGFAEAVGSGLRASDRGRDWLEALLGNLDPASTDSA